MQPRRVPPVSRAIEVPVSHVHDFPSYSLRGVLVAKGFGRPRFLSLPSFFEFSRFTYVIHAGQQIIHMLLFRPANEVGNRRIRNRLHPDVYMEKGRALLKRP